MMKNSKFLQATLVAGAMVLALAGCADKAADVVAPAPPAEAVPSSASANESAAQGGKLVENSKATMEELNQVLKDHNLYDEAYCFQDSYIFNDFETCAIYRTTGIMGMNAIVVYQKAENKYYAIDLGKYSTHTLQSISADYERPNLLRVYLQGDYFGGDYIYEHFMEELVIDLATSEVKEAQVFQTPGRYGMLESRDNHKFKTCEAAGNTVTFTFDVVPGGVGNGYPGPEIIIAQDGFYSDEQGRTSGMIYFRNTEQNLTGEMVESMSKLEGVESVSVTYNGTAPFVGTTLMLIPKEGYEISYLFNKSGEVNILEDFNISCVRIETEEAMG